MAPVRPARTSVLFVDDEARILEGMRRMLRSVRDEWDMEFANSSQAALDVLARRHFDVIVADMRMPGLDGAELLGRVKAQYPDTVRLILSGHADTQSVLRAVGVTHQYLNKPCDALVLKTTITRAFALRALLSDVRLKRLVGRIDTLPSMPAAYRDLMTCLRAPGASLVDAGRIVGRDPAMSVKVLQLVNSAYFGLARSVSSVERAVSFLGLDTLMALVLGHGIFAESKPTPLPGIDFEQLWARSLRVASAARVVAEAEQLDAKTREDAFLAGLLHDLGTLVLAAEIPDEYSPVIHRAAVSGDCRRDAEREILGTTHAEVGAYLIGLWGLPDSLVEAIAFHEQPSLAPTAGVSLAGIVHLAERLVDLPTGDGHRLPADVDQDWLDSLGRADPWTGFYQAWQGLEQTADAKAQIL